MTYAETDLLATIESRAGGDLAALSRADRDRFDQFHSGGAEAVDRLLPGLRLTAGMTVLDVGSGLGGPARQVAGASGARVRGVDITRAYVEVAAALTRAAGLEDRVDFVCTDIAAFEGRDFDAAYTMHVQMNVADKAGFFSEIAHRLRPGARLAVFEVCRTGEALPAPPLPWSLDGSDSHLADAAELRDTIVASGFELLDWVDETPWVLRWFEDLGRSLAEAPASMTLPALLDDGPSRMVNFAVALSTGVLSVHRGLFCRPAASS